MSRRTEAGNYDWVIVDGIGAFFGAYAKRRINWSKIPLAELPVEGEEADRYWEGVREDMTEFVKRVRAHGYNTVTLDDVAHLTAHRSYSAELMRRVERLSEEMRKVIAIIKGAGLKVLMTTDAVPTSGDLVHELGGKRARIAEYFYALIDQFLTEFPEVDGVVLRLGEGDGKDVKGDLHNTLFVETAQQANQLLKGLLQVMERHGKMLLCRTWTVGAYQVGDLIWHRRRVRGLLQGIESPKFILSLKYGESDFFRYLPLTQAFFETEVPKVIEFQARREYEGAGEYPSFIGWDVENYAHQLEQAQNLVGFSVWVQTGGWHAFKRRSYLASGSYWVELNSAVTVQVMQYGLSVDAALTKFYGSLKLEQVRRFLELANDAVLRGLYIEEFAKQKWFFRRVRIPPLLHVYWDCIFFQHPIKKISKHFVGDWEKAIADGYDVLQNFSEMESLARTLGWGGDDVQFMHDTFEMIALSREYMFAPFTEELRAKVIEKKRAYKAKYPRSERSRYRIKTDFTRVPLSSQDLSILQRLFFRKKRGYRVIDHLVTLRLLGRVYRIFHRRYEHKIPKFARKSAMGIETVLK
ncbi:hypothetical protein [Rubritalea marina]|uniref:hypothetical protein n=1 Tax=Rubritalea marina TaxID=361055 RepID=UPI00037A1DC7|nr:hypothetical protein [Rubritalea marina]